MLRCKLNIVWVSLVLCLGLLSEAESARMGKHVLVAYDISQSMRGHWDRKDIERINKYLTELLFDGLPEISPEDKIISIKEAPFIRKGYPLLNSGDRLSLVKFGAAPIPSPELSEIYDGSPSLRREVTKRLPKRTGELREDWTCIELLHWKASQIFREYSQLEPYLIVLISDKCESRYPLSLEDQKRILWYKEKYKKEVLLDIQVGVVHLDASRLIPPVSGITVLEPNPWKGYSAGEPLLISARVIKEGDVLKEEGWEVVATVAPQGRPKEKKEVVLNDRGLGKDEQLEDGIYTGEFLDKKGGPVDILIKAVKGPLEFQSEQLHLAFSTSKHSGLPLWFLITVVITLGLVLYHWLWPLRFWIEVSEAGGPPRRIKLKGVGDILFLGKREDEPYIDLGLPKYSILRQKRKEAALWREGKEEGEIVPWERWFSPSGEEKISFRFSLKRPNREGAGRREAIRAREESKPKQVEGEDFYKL